MLENWRRVAFTDESQFEIYGSRHHLFIIRRLGEQLRLDYLWPTVKFGGGTYMVWGMIHFIIPISNTFVSNHWVYE